MLCRPDVAQRQTNGAWALAFQPPEAVCDKMAWIQNDWHALMQCMTAQFDLTAATQWQETA